MDDGVNRVVKVRDHSDRQRRPGSREGDGALVNGELRELVAQRRVRRIDGRLAGRRRCANLGLGDRDAQCRRDVARTDALGVGSDGADQREQRRDVVARPRGMRVLRREHAGRRCTVGTDERRVER